jgi:hypothetical protein
MNITIEAVRDAAAIIEAGLSPSRRPPTQRLQALVAAYQTNMGGARTAAKEMAAQFGLTIVDVVMEGIVLAIAPERDSIFIPKRNDLLKEPGSEARLVRGLCNAAILACAYERQQSLISEAVQTVTVNDAYDLLVSASAALSKVDDPKYKGFTEAALIVERIKAESFSSKSERARLRTLRGRLIEAFETFVTQGQMVKDGEEEGGTYKTLFRLRKLLADESATAIVDVIKEAVEKSRGARDYAVEEASHA